MLTPIKLSKQANDTAQTKEEGAWRLFNPSLDDDGTAYATLRRLLKLRRGEALAELTAMASRPANSSTASLKAAVAASLLRDLLQIGWDIRVDASHIHVRPPGGNEPALRKAATRQQLLFGRDDQLQEASNRKFLFGLERPSRTSSAKPVTELIADGRKLASQLSRIASMPRDLRATELVGVCSPYLQLVTDARDTHTNIRLIDIWRYFRHGWSTRYRSSPGRNLFYLIRDGAQKNHPVIGIAALGNAVMQLTPRDIQLGWSADGLTALCDSGDLCEDAVLAAFKDRLEEDYDQIFKEDFGMQAAIELHLDDDTMSRLYVIEQDSAKERTDALRGTDETVPGRAEHLDDQELEKLARTPLYRAKRARTLREILRAYRTIGSWTRSLRDLCSNDEGLWAVNLVIKQLKKRFGATSLMEITVCGAVPPYNHLLGGKLVCYMMMSPQVVRDYHERYASTVSIIASQMAGRRIVKEPSLVYLGTTSLYGDNSSQYNRVKLPVTAVTSQRASLTYHEVGRTEGYGSLNLSSETETGLAEIARRTNGFRNVNFVFGEGQSPKLRQLREGLSCLGLDQSNLLQHGSPRIIYGVALAANFRQVLLGIDSEPAHLIPLDSDSAGTEIANYWTTRWLASRLDHKPSLEAVAKSSPLTDRVSRLIPEREAVERRQASLQFDRNPNEDTTMSATYQGDERLQFIRNLYRNEAAYSDDVSLTRLKELNIKTKLDEVVRKVIRSSSSVVITGNAGDGKTHALRLMSSDLKGAEVITDASEYTYEEIVTKWQRARDDNKPFCIAINEGPLVDLLREYRAKHSWLDEVRDQLLSLVNYRPLESSENDKDRLKWQPEPGSTVVLDLSQRHTLSSELSAEIIGKITEDRWYESCGPCPHRANCAVTYNRAMLRNPQTRDRVVALLAATAEAGEKVTFREALGFVSFAIFGGNSCEQLQEIGSRESLRYYNNAFEGEGTIFQLLERGIDPVQQTNPQVDESLWRGKFEPHRFGGHQLAPLQQRNFDELEDRENRNLSDDFALLKRRWYFEHDAGKLLDFSTAKALLNELENTSLTMAIRVGKLITLINRWWDRNGDTKADVLRLWTRLSFHPRSRSKAMVSGMVVNRQKLRLMAPELTPVLHQAFGTQPIDHLVLAPVEGSKFARLVVDVQLLEALLHGSTIDSQSDVTRRLTQFNETLSALAEKSSDVRTIEIVDIDSDLRTTVSVDLVGHRYDTAS